MENFNFKKSLGQNFLKDENIINKIVDSANIDKDTLVIEIGPGAGSLSKKIVPLSGFSLLYEIDTRLKDTLNDILFKYDNYEIIFNDFLRQDIIKDVSKYKYTKRFVVANLPYYITTPIIVKLMKEIMPDKMVIMIQDEVADRLSAKVGTRDFGMITVLLGAFYNVRKLFKVSRNCFVPSPNIDSAVILMEKNNNNKINDIEKFTNLIKDSFQYKRKNLKNNLKKYDLDKIENILLDNNLSLCNRAEDLPVDIFIEIANNL